MKPYCIALCLMSLLAMPARAANPDDCAHLERMRTGKNCGKPDSVELTLTNRCGSPMDLRFCLETRSGKWNCGLQFGVPTGKAIQWLTCEGTGEYKLWARTPKASAQFPDESGHYRSAGRATFAVASGETEESACKRASDMPGAGGECDCEAADMNADVMRCRVLVDPETVLPSGRMIKAFDPAMFSVVATSRNKELACVEARKLADSPDSACVCENKGHASQCRASASKIRSRSMRAEILKTLSCDPALVPECKPDNRGGSSGKRD